MAGRGRACVARSSTPNTLPFWPTPTTLRIELMMKLRMGDFLRYRAAEERNGTC